MQKNYPGFHAETVATHVNIIRTSDMLWRTLFRNLRPHGLTPPAMGVLFLLDSQKEPITMSSVGEQMVVTQANITGLIDTLEKLSLAKRTPHAKDRRVTRVEITPAGRKKIKEFWPHVMATLKDIYSDVTGDEKKTILRALKKIRLRLLPILSALLLALCSGARAQEKNAPPLLTLKEAVSLSLAQGPALAAARAGIDAALARQLAILGSYDASLSGVIKHMDAKTPPAVFFQTPRTLSDTGSLSLTKRFATATQASATSSLSKESDDVSSSFTLNPRVSSKLDLTLTQSLLKGFLGGPERSLLHEAEYAVRTARAEYERAAELHAQRVSAAYWQLWQSRRNRKVLLDAQEEAREFLETTQKLFKRFEAEKDDLLRAQASLLAKDLDVIEADQRILERSEILRELTAQKKLDAGLEDPDEPIDPPTTPEALQEAFSARRDLAARKFAAERDRMHLNSLAGLGWPSLDLSGSMGWSGLQNQNSESLRQLGRMGFRTWSIGLNLSYAFGARADKGAQLSARSMAMLSDEKTRELMLTIEREVEISAARLRLAKRRTDITRQLEAKQMEAFEITRQKYKQARISSQDRLTAANIAILARAERIRAQADGAVSETEHKASIGGLLAWLGIKTSPEIAGDGR